jgi:hypothetical protein
MFLNKPRLLVYTPLPVMKQLVPHGEIASIDWLLVAPPTQLCQYYRTMLAGACMKLGSDAGARARSNARSTRGARGGRSVCTPVRSSPTFLDDLNNRHGSSLLRRWVTVSCQKRNPNIFAQLRAASFTAFPMEAPLFGSRSSRCDPCCDEKALCGVPVRAWVPRYFPIVFSSSVKRMHRRRVAAALRHLPPGRIMTLMSYRILGALTRARPQEMRLADAADPLALTPQHKTLRAVRARLTGEVEPQYPDLGTASDARLKPLRSPRRHLDLIPALSDGWDLHRFSIPHRRTCTCAQASR